MNSITAFIFLTRWRLIAINLTVTLLIIVVLLILYSFYKMARAKKFGINMQSFYRLLIGYSEVEKKYIEFIYNLEQGKRSKNEIKDYFRKLVQDDPQVRFPEYSSEKVLKDFRKLINNK